MKLKVKHLGILSGMHLVALLHKDDAQQYDIHPLDRIKIRRNNKIETAVVNTSSNDAVMKKGYIGLFEGVRRSLATKNGEKVTVSLAKKPHSLAFIKKKMEGCRLKDKEIHQIVWDIVHNKLTDTELTYFVAACYTNSMNMKETVCLTKAIASQGEILKLNTHPIIDKHCIGGIPGNRTTMVLVPLIAAAGYTIPKTSSRSITSPAGTADTMETLASVSLTLPKMKSVVSKHKGCIVWGGALNLAPADDKIIHVEKPLEIDAESQLLASIMAKKHSVSSTHILIDIPLGRDAKVRSKTEALHLKKQFERIGKELKKKIKVVLTDGSQPIGNGIGPSLEARDVLWLLKRDPRRPLDLERKCVMMAGDIFSLIGVKNGRKKAVQLLESGKAYEKMVEIIQAQCGKEVPAEDLPVGKYTHVVKARKKGKVKHIDNIVISRVARIAGAPVQKGAGLYLHHHVDDKIKKGEKLYTIYSESREKLKFAREFVSQYPAFEIG